MLSTSRRSSQGSQGSFHMLVEPPSSPDSRGKASPTPSSSSTSRKRRVAVSRRTKSRHSTDRDPDGAGAGVGRAAEGEEPVSWEEGREGHTCE